MLLFWWSYSVIAGYFEGDMVLSPEEIEHFVNGTSKYGSMIGGRWPKGIVPYVIQSSIGKSLIWLQGMWLWAALRKCFIWNLGEFFKRYLHEIIFQ